MKTLSDKEVLVDAGFGRNGPIYNREAVKEFIKQLKDHGYIGVAHKGHWTKKQVLELVENLQKEWYDLIDKLAGDKLT